MTINQAVEFFENIPTVLNKIKVLQDVGLGYIKLGQPSTTLSGGESQRVKLATELAKRDTGKTLYILDEPTSGLDPLMQREFYTILKERNDEGATVFLSSHILSEVQRYCKRAAVIREGRILACDSVERLGYTGAKRVTLKGASELPKIENIKDIKEQNGALSFLYSGSSEELVRRLAQISFEDITIADPDLDEIFMHYYEKEDC
jgi:ABC-2 type transport system ATP-binding protein